jgi:hypothetical protein
MPQQRPEKCVLVLPCAYRKVHPSTHDVELLTLSRRFQGEVWCDDSIGAVKIRGATNAAVAGRDIG